MVNLGNDWDEVLKGEFDKEYYQKLRKFLLKNIKQELYIQKWRIFFQH